MSRPVFHRMLLGDSEEEVRVMRSAQRRKTIALQLTPDGRLSVRAPLRTPLKRIEEVVRGKATWIKIRRNGIDGDIPYPNPPREFVSGESFFVLGRQHRLKMRLGQSADAVFLDGDFLRLDLIAKTMPARETLRAHLQKWFSTQAREFLTARVNRWLKKIDVREDVKVLVTDQSKRWASCGRGAVLRFNWRLFGAPVSLIDYVLAHELCHLRHPDHSEDFWYKLRRAMPDYIAREQRLLAVGGSLVF